jgi:hypothetical protein
LEYPEHKDPLASDKKGYDACISKFTPVCFDVVAYLSDPIGSTATTVGKEVGERMRRH